MKRIFMNGRRTDDRDRGGALLVVGIVLGVIALVVGLVAAVAISTYQGIVHDGVGKETHLMATYANQEIEYNKMATTVADSMNIAGAQKDAAIAIFTATMKSRFGDNPSQGQLVTFTHENYPDITITQKTYADILTALANNREKFAQAQKVVIDEATAYDRWLRQNWPNSIYIGWAGYPSSHLKLERNDTTLTGRAALEEFMKPLLTGLVKERFNQNQDGSLVPSSAPSASSTKK